MSDQWVIQHGDDQCPVYWTEHPWSGCCLWDTRIHKAARFPSRDEAIETMLSLEGKGVVPGTMMRVVPFPTKTQRAVTWLNERVFRWCCFRIYWVEDEETNGPDAGKPKGYGIMLPVTPGSGWGTPYRPSWRVSIPFYRA